MAGLGFLDQFSASMFENAGMGENTPGSLNYGGKSFAALGDFAEQIDTSAHRSYVEDGMVRNIRPRISEIMMQEPDITIVVKKRMFSTLAENYRMDLMDDQEKLFVRASKKLFYNKCKAIAAYERLTKISKIGSEYGFISDTALPMIFGVVDILDAVPTTTPIIDNKSRIILDTIRKVKNLSDPNFTTTWIVDKDLPYVTDTGEGLGTFELTLVASVNTTTSTILGSGKCDLQIEDPYKLMIMTNDDIDLAIKQATNKLAQNNFFKMSETQLSKSIADLKKKLDEIRSARKVAPIFFKTSENTILSKKIKAFIDQEGREILFNFSAGQLGADLFSTENSTVEIDPTAWEGYNGLSEKNNEAGFFKQIVHNMYLLMGLQHTTDTDTLIFNEEMSQCRRKMRLHYANKPIIQPMDVVYVFMSSKTVMDSKLVQGMKFNWNDQSIVNQIDQAVSGIEDAIDDIRHGFGGSSNSEGFIEIEKNSIAGPDFPMWLWMLMRNDFTRQAAGTCTFVGPVESSSHKYNEGQYKLSVNVKDNSFYLGMGHVNVQPSSKVYNGALYEPLTPFKLDYDSASGFITEETPNLLEENIILLNSGCVRAKLGRDRNKNISTFDYFSKEMEKKGVAGAFGQKGYRRNYFDPDGFVYRWKEGIGSIIVYGEPHSSSRGTFNKETSPAYTKDPYAGQDVMNVLSLLVTGEPYNYNTYLRSALQLNKLSRDDFTNQGTSSSFFKGLTKDILSKNATWGNFVPFKKIIYNDRASQFALMETGKKGLLTINTDLQMKTMERARLTDQLFQLSPEIARGVPQFYLTGEGGQPVSSQTQFADATVQKLITDIQNISIQIKQQRVDFDKRLSNYNPSNTVDGSFAVLGNDISYDPSVTGLSDSANESDRRRERNELRDKIKYLTQRRLWAVKGNTDNNLFIVDETYDKNYDIQAFEQSMIKIGLFSSTYQTILEQVKRVSEILDLEIFADSQGHIQARPKQYNRIPKSVFRDMLMKKVQTGTQLFPEYLERLFYNKMEGLTDHLEIVEDKLRLYAAAIGYSTDYLAAGFIKRNGDGSFNFLTSEDGQFLMDLAQLTAENNVDIIEDLKKAGTTLNAASKSSMTFSIVNRLDIINKRQSVMENLSGAFSDTLDQRIEIVSNRLRQRGIQNIPTTRRQIAQDTKDISKFQYTDTVKTLDTIANLVAERQRLVKTLANTFRNWTQGQMLEAKHADSTHVKMFPALDVQLNKELPEIIEHMIEDESIDDLGYKSGRRYIIEDSQIISFDITEKGPDYTAAVVTGSQQTGLVPWPAGEAQLNGMVGGAGSGGNALGSAAAVDYDMWRMYGYRKPQEVQALFFSNPQTQCAPYAVFLLNLARKNIFTANATLAGNEYMQPGEVYYIEDKDMLFYAEEVTHNYTFGETFQTSMRFVYGRNPGEYIPTQADVIGNALYGNGFDAGQVKHVRHDRADDSSHVGTIVYDGKSTTYVNSYNVDDTINQLLGTTYGEQNRKSLANIMLAAGGWTAQSGQYNKKLTLEIRYYKNLNKEINLVESVVLPKIAEAVKSWILNPQKSAQLSPSGQKVVADDKIEANETLSIEKDDIQIVAVDLGSKAGIGASPSSEAWSTSRGIINSAVESNAVANKLEEQELQAYEQSAKVGEKEKEQAQEKANEASRRLTQALSLYIIDVWAVFKSIPKTMESGGKAGEQAMLTQVQIDLAAQARNNNIKQG